MSIFGCFKKNKNFEFEINGKKAKIIVLEKDTDPCTLLLEEREDGYKIAGLNELNSFFKKNKKMLVHCIDVYGNINDIFNRQITVCKTTESGFWNVDVSPIIGLPKGTRLLLIEK